MVFIIFVDYTTDAAKDSALAFASSRVPTYMKDDSGRSSPSPSHNRSKESTVSSSVEFTPGNPVNVSATYRG